MTRDVSHGFADLAEKLLPAVVNISTTQTIAAKPGAPKTGPETPQLPPGSPFEDFFKDFFDHQDGRGDAPPRRATSLGSGFIVDPDGYVVTNNHVIQDADEIMVVLHDDTNLKAEVVGRDTKTDIALLKVKSDKPLTAVPFGNSDTMRVGDWVLAIGNPFGLGGTVTSGIISARARDINAGPYDDFLQTDASINRGNSGGPMFNLNGEVIGINTAIFSPSGGSVGIGFAIPSALAKPVVEQLRKYGHTRRGWLGVKIQGVTPEIADTLRLAKASGALVASVTAKGPAVDAGIQAGDVILTFDGKDVTDMRRLPRIVAETEIGRAVPVTVWRKGQPIDLSVKVGELEAAEQSGLVSAGGDETPAPAPAQTISVLGLKLSSLTTELRKQYNLNEALNGVVITEVASTGPASEKGLRPGDVIVEVAQEDVTKPGDVVDKINKAKDDGRKSVLLLVDRQGDLRFVALAIAQG
ncbi:MAG: DegQ family serine endoprotease [Azospirillaceae bacterium]|nr:DegQ family serine endoprotease [Azospirillaceae bacterium]